MSTIDKNYLSGLFYDKPERLDDLVKLLGNFTLPILSIGSGNGYVESYIKEKLPTNDIICVDPDPESFCKYHPDKHIKPSFNYVSDLDIDKYQNSILFINWPNPQGTNNGYDIGSILELKPGVICVSYGPCGASGSDHLINILAEYGSEQSFSGFGMIPGPSEGITIGSTCYNLVYSYTLTIGSGYGFTGRTKRLVVYVRKDHMKNFDSENPVILSETNPNDRDCIIS